MNGHPDWPGIRLVDEQRCTEAACEEGGVYYSHALVTRLWPATAPLPTIHAWQLLAANQIEAAEDAGDEDATTDWKAVAHEWRTT